MIRRFKKEWKLYCTAIWMFLSLIVFTWISVELMQINRQLDRVASDINAIESIVTATDFNVDNMNKDMASVESVVKKIAIRVKRR